MLDNVWTVTMVLLFLVWLLSQENEYVVRRVMLDNASKFDIVHILPDWPTRGLPVFTKGNEMITITHNNRMHHCG